MSDPVDGTLYPPDQVRNIRIAYLIGIIFWMLLIYVLGITICDTISLIIFLIPFVAFGITCWNLSGVTVGTEKRLCTINCLTIGLFLVLSLVTWSHDKHGEDTRNFRIAVIAIILGIITLIDVWVPPDWVLFVMHVRSILNVLSMCLIIFCLYILFGKKCGTSGDEIAEVGGAYGLLPGH